MQDFTDVSRSTARTRVTALDLSLTNVTAGDFSTDFIEDEFGAVLRDASRQETRPVVEE
jgi:hypothetical protein